MRDRSEKISKLLSSRAARESYIRSKLNVLLPSQVRGLRLRRELKQEELGERAEMKQSRISAMERPGETSFNVETLVRLAAALDVGLKVEFVPFSELLRWDNAFSQDSFKVTPLAKDEAFLNPAGVAEELRMIGVMKQESNDSDSMESFPNAGNTAKKPMESESDDLVGIAAGGWNE